MDGGDVASALRRTADERLYVALLELMAADAEGLSDTEGELLLLLDEHPAVRRHVSSA